MFKKHIWLWVDVRTIFYVSHDTAQQCECKIERKSATSFFLTTFSTENHKQNRFQNEGLHI
jgi:hypothetical protein